MTPNAVENSAAADSISKMRSWLHRFLPVVLGGGLLALILSRTDLARLALVLTGVHWQWYALAQALVAVNLLIVTGRWRFDLGLLKLHYPFRELFLIDNAGALAGAATPGRMGDLARLIYFRQEKDVLVRVGLSILVERVLDLLSLIWLTTGFLFIFPLPIELRQFLLHLIFAAHLAGLAFALVTWRFWGKNWLTDQILRLIPHSLSARFSGHAQDFLTGLGCYTTWRLIWPVSLSLLNWGVSILGAEFSARALSLPLSFWQIGGCFCLSTMFTLIPMSVAGIGTRELAMVYLFSILGLPSEKAIAFSFLLLGFLLTHSLVGFLALLVKPPHSRQQPEMKMALPEENH